jgi:hypothetical protein
MNFGRERFTDSGIGANLADYNYMSWDMAPALFFSAVKRESGITRHG